MEKDKNHTTQNRDKDELVTVAIHSYEKAHILKSILESEGIPAIVQGVNLIQPVVPGNMRVRINESDLPQALKIIEQIDFSSKINPEEEDDDNIQNEILIPVDFSNYSERASEFGFRLAHDMGCNVKLLHAFFTPFYPASIPFGDSFSVQAPDQELYAEVKKKMEKEMKKLTETIEAKIARNELPDVRYSQILVEGLPEEEIIAYSKKMHPKAIVMGSRGKNAKDLDLIGSVTAEVIEGCKTPIFAIPENVVDVDIAEMKSIVFLTNFQEREFKAFDVMMRFLNPYPVKVYLAHISKKDDVWNEIKLSGLREYLKEHYPLLETEYKLLDPTEKGLEETLDEFVRKYEVDMISMSSSRRNIFARVFNPGIARRMLFHSDTPLLVIKGS